MQANRFPFLLAPLVRLPVFCTLRVVFIVFATLPAGAQNQAWIRQLGTTGYDSVDAAALDESGGVYVTGRTVGSLGGPSAGNVDTWLARYDGVGNQTWIRQFGTIGNESNYPWAAASDGSGGVFLGGLTTGALGGPTAGNADAWLAHYDGAGNRTWIRQFGTIDDDEMTAAAPDGSGGVYACGRTPNSLGGPSAGFWDAWIARYDGVGNRTWIRQLGTSGVDYAYGAAADGTGGVYVCGWTDGNLGGPSAGGIYDAWLARYDSAGSLIWIRQLGTSSFDYANAAAPDGTGGVYVCGRTRGSLGGPSAGTYDAWLARYDGVGNQAWVRQLGTSTDDSATAAAPSGSGGVYLVGYTSGALGGPNAGGLDVWMTRYDSAGNQHWVHQIGTSSADRPSAAASEGWGCLYVGGRTTGSLGGPYAGGIQDDAWFARYEENVTSTFCTAKAGLACGSPQIDAIGIPSVSATSGFVIRASPARSCKSGVLMYNTTSLAVGVPFQGGTLCVTPSQVRRGGPTNSQGTPGGANCDGALALDMNAFAASKWSVPDCGGLPSGLAPNNPAAFLLLAGQDVYCQFWGRDSVATGSFVSAGILYTIEP